MTMAFGTQSEVRQHLIEVALRDVRRWLREHPNADPHPDHLFSYQETYEATRMLRTLYCKGIVMTTELDDQLWNLDEIKLPGTDTVVLARLVTPYGSIAIWAPDNLLEILKTSEVTVAFTEQTVTWWRWCFITLTQKLRTRFLKRRAIPTHKEL